MNAEQSRALNAFDVCAKGMRDDFLAELDHDVIPTLRRGENVHLALNIYPQALNEEKESDLWWDLLPSYVRELRKAGQHDAADRVVELMLADYEDPPSST